MVTMMHRQWRDCQELKKLGLPLSTTSNEACKMYDAGVSQLMAWYSDPSLGGLEGTFEKLFEADPNCVMGHVFSTSVLLDCQSLKLHPELQKSVQIVEELGSKNGVTEWEKRHVKAISQLAKGQMMQASDTWRDITMDYPMDLLALRMCHMLYFHTSQYDRLRDSVATMLPHYNDSIPLSSYLYGVYAFGLEETNLYGPAEKYAMKAISLNPTDTWAVHVMAHIMEMQGRYDEGIKFMNDTMDDWKIGNMIAGHNYWHLALYHIQKGEYQAALDLYDKEFVKRWTPASTIDIADANSLLLRLEMEGVNVEGRWNDIYEADHMHAEEHANAFYDVHVLMSSLRAKKDETTQKLMSSLEEYIKTGEGYNHQSTKEVGMNICQALIKYDGEDFGAAVELLYPVRYDIYKIGGSAAQRDEFNLLLINAAIQSPKKEHQKLARNLLAERKALKENSPLTDRLMARALASHGD